eukprot:TRINITY_DN9373_c0_g4_i1.p1 TRINITY_DN9373_c0_g4~~TRINITY_DN9373_c0_g4_i1.p1  ORF type:complete len:356 (-),score=90.46 TRINITY_DN9373_c0_g4_i1:245-1312(-)
MIIASGANRRSENNQRHLKEVKFQESILNNGMEEMKVPKNINKKSAMPQEEVISRAKPKFNEERKSKGHRLEMEEPKNARKRARNSNEARVDIEFPKSRRGEKSYKEEKAQMAEETEERRRKRNSEIKKSFFEQYIVKADENLDLTNKQKEIVDLFQVSFKRHKGNRSLILDRELTRLKEIPLKYKEVEVSSEVVVEDLDTCGYLGEKVYKTREGYVWRQVDITAMKQEKHALLEIRRKEKLLENEKIMLLADGQVIGDRNVHKRKPIAEQDEGRVKLLYRRASGPLSVHALNIERDGEFTQQLKGEKMVLKLLQRRHCMWYELCKGAKCSLTVKKSKMSKVTPSSSSPTTPNSQ